MSGMPQLTERVKIKENVFDDVPESLSETLSLLNFWPIGWIWSMGWNKLKCCESRLQRHEGHAFEFFSVRQFWQFCHYCVKYLHLAELLFRWKEITKPTRSWTVSVNFCSIKISLLNRLHYWHFVVGCLVINSYLFKNFSFYFL